MPTEVDPSWEPAGDDAVRGFLWTHQKYDWMGRVVRKINTDGEDSAVLNDSDILISYEGCGCAGGLVTTVQGESVPRDDQQAVNARRTRKVYEDILGRAWKTVVFKWDGTTPYTTTEQAFNGRDQVLRTRQTDNTSTATPQSYQDYIASYDGFGRVKTSHRPEQQNSDSTNAHVTTTYNSDNSIASVVDARGVTTNYSYNILGLVEQIDHAVPVNSNIPVTPAIHFSHDGLGNRLQMIDATGTTSYQYDELSRIVAETKVIPGIVEQFTMGYEYTLAGELSRMTLPSNKSFSYSPDKLGRVSSVSGQGFNAGTTPISNIITDMRYRAWGDTKSIDYGSSAGLATLEYNNALKVSSFRMPNFIETDYLYQADGRLKFVDTLNRNTLTDNDFDRSYQYDHLGRLKYAKTGDLANGGTGMTGPYNESFGFDSFDNPTSRVTEHWDRTYSFENSFERNRRVGAQYDPNGNMTALSGVTYTFDAADMNTKVTYPLEEEGTSTILRTQSYKTQAFDGDGQAVSEFSHESQNSYTGPYVNHLYTREASEYHVKSTVLGGVNVVTYRYYSARFNNSPTSYGQNNYERIFLDGKLLAVSELQWNSPGWSENFVWKHYDPAVTFAGNSGPSYRGLIAALDPTGADVGFANPYIDPDPPPPPPRFHGEFATPEQTELVEVDGVLTPLWASPGWSGVVSQCPSRGCGAIRTENGWEYWTAFADGYEGYMPTASHYAGNGKWSGQTREQRRRRTGKFGRGKGPRPKLKTRPASRTGPSGTTADNESEISDEIPKALDPNGGLLDIMSKVLFANKFIERTVRFIGFSGDEQSALWNRLLMTLIWQPCIDAYSAFPKIKALPAQVMNGRGLTFVNANRLSDPSINSEFSSPAVREAMFNGFDGVFGFLFGVPRATTFVPNNYEQARGERIVIALNLAHLWSDLDEDVFHEVIHGGGVPGQTGISGGLSSVHDLSNYGKRYSTLIAACKPLAK